MPKTARHKAILDLLEAGPVESQDALQHSLERKGFAVGQATLSRDIHELKLVKGPEGYRRASESLGAEGVLPSVVFAPSVRKPRPRCIRRGPQPSVRVLLDRPAGVVPA